MSFLIDLFEGELLIERKQYAPMFEAFINACYQDAVASGESEDEATIISLAAQKMINNSVKRIRTALLNRNDRVTWFLNRSRAALCLDFVVSNKYRPGKATTEVLNTYYARAIAAGEPKGSLQGMWGLVKVGEDIRNLESDYQPSGHTFKRLQNLSHFLGIQYNPIQAYIFGNQSTKEILSHFEKLEKDYQEIASRAKRAIKNVTDDATKIIDFNDGFAWYDLNTSVSRQEATAMVHCCTDPRTQHGGTVYSLRQDVGKEGVIPRVTAMIKDRELYEIKGYNNQKPNERYHPYLIALLKSDYIDDMNGGGYKPENNFVLNDLPEAQARSLIKAKPGLASPEEVVRYFPEGSQELETYIDNISSRQKFMDLKKHLSDNYLRHIFDKHPEFAETNDILRVYGADSEQMIKHVKLIDSRYAFTRLMERIKEESVKDKLKSARPDFLEAYDLDRLFGVKSKEFIDYVNGLEEVDLDEDDSDRITLEGADRLSKEAKSILIKNKPNALSLQTYIDMFGTDSKIAMQRYMALSENIDDGLSTFDKNHYYLESPSGMSIGDFIDEFGNDLMKNYYGSLVGDGHEFYDTSYDTPDNSDVVDLMTDEIHAALKKFIIENYEDDDYEDIDLDDLGEIVDFAMSEIDEFETAAKYAYQDGARTGAENEAYEYFKSAINEAVFKISDSLNAEIRYQSPKYDGNHNPVKYEPTYENTSKEYEYDAKVWVVVAKDRILEAFNDPYFHEHWSSYYFDDLPNYNSDQEFLSMEEPYYGFSGYDIDSAKESFETHLYDQFPDLNLG
jgi:hypothetical protein